MTESSEYCEVCGDLKTPIVYPSRGVESRGKMLERRSCEKEICREVIRNNKRKQTAGFKEKPRPVTDRFIDAFNLGLSL